MDKTKQEFQRQRAARRAAQEAAAAKAVQEQEKKASATRAALARTSSHKRTSCSIPDPKLSHIIEKKARRLTEADVSHAVFRLCALPHVRTPDTWRPHGKGRDTLFRSLADHLIAKFPMPAFLWNAFSDNVATFVPLVAHVAAGGSLYAFVKENLPIPLTRAMCHDLLTTTSEWGFLDAVRRVQCRAAGTDPNFFQIWKTLRHVNMVGSKEDEAFWFSVLEWFGKAGMLSPGEIGPLCDYIEMRRWGEADFSMKGRTVTATLRAMREWHGNLTKERSISQAIFRTSGFNEARFSDYYRREEGKEIHETWRVEEILTAKALHNEGRRMNHCVSSYSHRIEKGDTSIWSVVMEDGKGETGAWAMVTLEVRNVTKQVVQARGRFNRSMTSREHQVVSRWANLNNLTLNFGHW